MCTDSFNAGHISSCLKYLVNMSGRGSGDDERWNDGGVATEMSSLLLHHVRCVYSKETCHIYHQWIRSWCCEYITASLIASEMF